ncbi:hypothetical protein N9B31_06640 [Mariniblastus sp.]|nr:hypothetical protein [Mariniblastus sp.]
MDPHERLGPNQSAKIEAECLTTAQSTAKMQVRSGSKSLSVHPAFSVQYHPEASAGPHDSQYLFGQFKEMIDSNRVATEG